MIRSVSAQIICIYIWALPFFFESSSFAFSLRPTVITGLMQQPSSQYYHFMYGINSEVTVYNSWGFRATYLERPAFSNVGFIDQDFIAYLDTGASFYKKANLEVLGYAGIGRAWGYIKEIPVDSNVKGRRNDYQLNLLSFSMEASYNAGFINTRLGHSMHVGHGDKAQTDVKVAWPYSTYYVSFSKLIGSSK